MPGPGLLIAAIFLLLLGNGFFSGSEIAVISASRAKLEALIAQGSRGAERVKHLQDDPDTFLATVQIGVTLCGTLAGVLGGYLASRHLEPAIERLGLPHWLLPSLVAGALVGGLIVFVELVLGELVPKALALRFTETVAVLVAWPIRQMARISHGLVVVLKFCTRTTLKWFGVRDPGTRTWVSQEEIKHMVREGSEQGVLEATQVELIHSVFEFGETPVRKVMVPRPKIFALDVNTPPEEVGRLIVESGFSRIPVFDGELDNILGLVYIKDALRLLEKHEPVALRRILHPVHFVPETKKVGQLLKELQKRRTHMALVIDEHGSFVGLVTMEDLLEEIVGDIRDEYDWEERPVERLRDGSLIVEGTVSAAELRDQFQVPIPESTEFQTVAGFMLERLGSVPKGGEAVVEGDYRFTVVDVERNRITKVKVELAKEATGAASGGGRASASR
jgi:putative hemolysin